MALTDPKIEKKISDLKYQYGKLDPAYEAAIRNGTEAAYFADLDATLTHNPPPNKTPGAGAPNATINAMNNPDIDGYIGKLQQAQEDALVAGLQKAKNNALSTLSSEESKIKPMYYDKRNAVSAGSQLGAKNFAEYLASRGEINSGVNDAATIARESSLQGAIGGLRKQEASDLSDIERRRTGVLNDYEADLAAGRAGLQVSAMEKRINEAQRQRDIAREDSRYNKEFDYRTGRDAISDERYSTEYQDRRSDIAWEREWQTSKDNPAYRMQLLQEKMAEFDLENAQNPNSLENQARRAQIANTWQNVQAGKISIDRAKWEFDNLKAGLNADGTERTTKDGLGYKDYVGMGMDMLSRGSYDSTLKQFSKMYSTSDVLNWVKGLPLSPEAKAQLANDLGLPRG